ncbi:GerW family sporulation protein [Paenibacillus septentrionalis]|uniref:GerW family sporulation protein n=1 Tax=Paenibacillus septentrionalis TaxID=429342 RepID=A0ABW1V0Q3_9BACL
MTTTNNIEGLVGVSLGQIKEMLGINTIVGDPIHTPSGDTILPISRVGVGFVAGGSELRTEHSHDEAQHGGVNPNSLPFGGGSGGGVSITPIAFLVVGMQGVKVVPLDNQTHLLDKVIDSAPAIIDKMSGMFGSSAQSQGQAGISSSTGAASSTSTGMNMNSTGGSSLQ